MMMTPEENMDNYQVFDPISEETLSELSLIDSFTVSNMAKELIMLRAEVQRLRTMALSQTDEYVTRMRGTP